MLGPNVAVEELEQDDAWFRDSGPTVSIRRKSSPLEACKPTSLCLECYMEIPIQYVYLSGKAGSCPEHQERSLVNSSMIYGPQAKGGF